MFEKKRKEKKIREEGYLVLGSQLSTCVRLSLWVQPWSEIQWAGN